MPRSINKPRSWLITAVRRPTQPSRNYRTTNREGYRQYHSDPERCRNCPVRHKCTQSANAIKVVTRHVWEDSRERIDQHRLSRVGNSYLRRLFVHGAHSVLQQRLKQSTGLSQLYLANIKSARRVTGS